MVTLSIVGIIIGLIFLIVTAWKGLSIYICAIGAAIIVLLFSNINVLEGLTGPFMTGFTTFIKNYLLLFLISTVFAKIMGDSGVAKLIAVKLTGLIKKAKPKNQPFFAILIVSCITLALTYGGINSFVIIFVMVALSKDIFKELDLPWRLYMLSAFGSATITMTMLPGSPSVQNLVPTSILGTSAMAAPVLGIIISVVCFFVEVLFVKFALRKVLKSGEGYYPSGQLIDSKIDSKILSDVPNYNIIVAILPCVALIIVMNVLGQSPLTAMAVACVLALILFHKTLPFKQIPITIKDGCLNAATTCLTVSCVVGFGACVSSTLGYASIMESLQNLGGSPLLQLVIAISVACGVSGSASGGLTIGLTAFADRFLAMGLNPQIIHRVACIASGGLDTLPHNAAVLVSFEAAGLNYKQAYIFMFVESVLIPLGMTFLAVALASFGIC